MLRGNPPSVGVYKASVAVSLIYASVESEVPGDSSGRLEPHALGDKRGVSRVRYLHGSRWRRRHCWHPSSFATDVIVENGVSLPSYVG